MTHPYRLHATAATWSLADALTTLDARAVIEDRAIFDQAAAAAEPLRSPSFGRRRALGGHGDPTGDAIATDGTARSNRYAELLDDVQEQLAIVVHHLPPNGTIDPLYRIREAIPGMQPGTAAATARLLVRLDERVRRYLRLPAARQLLSRVQCPACRRRLVYVQTAAPIDQQTVVCAADCRCSGVGVNGRGCGCGMPGAVEGVAHIWLRSAVIAGVTPTTLAA